MISCSARRTQGSHVSELLAESTFDSTSTTSAIDTTITTAADTMSYDIGLDYLSLLGEKSIEANFPSGKIKISNLEDPEIIVEIDNKKYKLLEISEE